MKLCEYYHLLEKLKPYLPLDFEFSLDATEVPEEGTVYHTIKNYYLCGVVPRENLLWLQKIIHRLSRNNCFLLTFNLEYDNENSELN